MDIFVDVFVLISDFMVSIFSQEEWVKIRDKFKKK